MLQGAGGIFFSDRAPPGRSKMKKLRFNLAAALVAIILLAANAPDMDFFQGHVNGKVAGFDKLDPAMFMAGPLKS